MDYANLQNHPQICSTPF